MEVRKAIMLLSSSAVIFSALVSIVILFQAALAFGMPWGEFGLPGSDCSLGYPGADCAEQVGDYTSGLA
jgi:hypothetical protein